MNQGRILVSVTNKASLPDLKPLLHLGWEFVSTGGTAKALQSIDIPCTLVEDVTGFPEMMNGRLKTLHPKIFGGILAVRANPDHMNALATHNIRPFDLVVVNLYDFAGKPGIEEIDIGGPSLIRAAAKNGITVGVLVDPNDYRPVVDEIVMRDRLSDTTRSRLAVKAFEYTANYDTLISQWMRRRHHENLPFLTPPAVSAH